MYMIEIKEDIIEDDKYKYAFSVEEVNRRAKEGTPFRDAYKQVGIEIEEGRFTPDKNINHTHEGSIGNLCLDKIAAKFARHKIDFSQALQAEEELMK